MKHIIRLKKMVNLALNLQWITNDPFATYKLKMQKVNREQLSEIELHEMENKKITIERLDIVRDMFVFCCYTGLSYVDLMNLSPAHIIAGADGERWIRTCREKTLIPVNVPLLPQALRILDKYTTHIRALADGKVFPIMSNQKVNSYLKELADICNITKNVTFHIARHTFATTVTLSNWIFR
jgi:integrase